MLNYALKRKTLGNFRRKCSKSAFKIIMCIITTSHLRTRHIVLVLTSYFGQDFNHCVMGICKYHSYTSDNIR